VILNDLSRSKVRKKQQSLKSILAVNCTMMEEVGVNEFSLVVGIGSSSIILLLSGKRVTKI